MVLAAFFDKLLSTLNMPKLPELKTFNFSLDKTYTTLQGEEADQWSEEVDKIMAHVADVEPEMGGFRGRIACPTKEGSFDIFWLSWRAFTREIRNSQGEHIYTSWAPVTLGVKPEDYDLAEKIVQKRYSAIWSAIFEICEEKRREK